MLCDGYTYFSQVVGVTSALPESVPNSLHPIYCIFIQPLTQDGDDSDGDDSDGDDSDGYDSGYQASSNEWIYRGNQLLHNETATDFPHLPSLDDRPPVGFSVGLLIDNTGALHIFFNGSSSERLATGLPINKPLWGVVDVCGYCTKIKSEMLSGKLNGVSVCVLNVPIWYIHVCLVQCT